jgi:hypothetical protein
MSETAVPVFRRERFAGLVEEQANWQDVLDATADNAPHEFILYWSHDFRRPRAAPVRQRQGGLT